MNYHSSDHKYDNTKPLVSVLTTVYNREKYLTESIESVLNSTYENFELIIVDDCSTDNSLKIARNYESKDARIKVIVNEQNLGDYGNRNKAASLANGRYLKYVDADDKIYPEGLEIMVSEMLKYPDAALGLITTNTDGMNLNSKEIYEAHYVKEEGHFDRSPLSAIISREKFESIGGFTGKRMVGDYELWHILSRYYPVVLISGSIAWYRIHEEQEMQDARTNLRFNLEYLLISLFQLQHSDCPLAEYDRRNSISVVRRRMARLIFTAVKNLQIQKALELYQSMNLRIWEIFYFAFKKV